MVRIGRAVHWPGASLPALSCAAVAATPAALPACLPLQLAKRLEVMGEGEFNAHVAELCKAKLEASLFLVYPLLCWFSHAPALGVSPSHAAHLPARGNTA